VRPAGRCCRGANVPAADRVDHTPYQYGRLVQRYRPDGVLPVHVLLLWSFAWRHESDAGPVLRGGNGKVVAAMQPRRSAAGGERPAFETPT